MLQIKVSIFRKLEKGSIYNLIHRRYHSIFFYFLCDLRFIWHRNENVNEILLSKQNVSISEQLFQRRLFVAFSFLYQIRR